MGSVNGPCRMITQGYKGIQRHPEGSSVDPIEPNRWYTPREAARLLDNEVTEETVKEYCRQSKLRARKKGPRKSWRIQGADIVRLRKEWDIDG